MGRVAAGRASGIKTFFAKTYKCVIINNSNRIGRGPGYQRPPQVSHSRKPVEIMLLLNKVKTKRRKRGGKRVKRQRKVWKGRRSLVRVDTLNIETMTGRGRELADMMEQRNVDILCLQEAKWKGSKARNIEGGCKIFYNGADETRNVIGIVMRKELDKGVLEMKRVSDRLMAMKVEVKGSILNILIVSAYAPQVNNSMEEKNDFWEDLDGLIESVSKQERMIPLMDMWAKET